jgi:general secretion pathway protein K
MRGVPEKERGAALLAVLLLVAVIGGLAAAAVDRLRLSTALALNTAAIDQARGFALGIESLLTMAADDVAVRSPEVTTLQGGWNGGVKEVAIPGGGIARGAVRDGANCFNLNSLASGDRPTALTANPAGMQQFAALMSAVGIDGIASRRVAASAADWLDSDSVPQPGGAEDETYARLPQPYRAANTMFAEASELRAVAGVTPEIYARLRPWICALPSTEMSPVNLNTLAPEQAPLLAMLAPGRMSLGEARRLIESRPAAGWRRLPLDGLAQAQLRTRWFALDLRVAMKGAELHETALVDARIAPARIAVRRWGSED